MLKENYFNKIKELPEFVKQTGGLVILVINYNFIFFCFKYYVWGR